MMRYLFGILLILFSFQLTSASAQNPPTVTICAEPDPPPWTYWKIDKQGKKTDQFVGSSVDILTAAFALIGKTVVFNGTMPWKRCLFEVENQQVDFAMDAYYDEDRAKIFDYSVHYGTLTPQIFYLSSSPVSIHQLSDLKHYRGCGINGFSYAHYGLTANDLDMGIGYDSLYRKLHAKRCDYFVEELEVIAGYKLIGKNYLDDPSISHSAVPGAIAPSKYLITVKNGKNSALMVQIDAAISELIKSGKAHEIWKVHAGDLPYAP